MKSRTFDFSKFNKLKSKALNLGTLNQNLLKWRTLKYLIALWVTITIYSLSSFFSGNMGLAAYNELGVELHRQEANIATLRRINGELGDMKDALLYDEETIALYARELGYGRQDETFIRIVGVDEKMKVWIDPGELIPVVKHPHNPDLVLKIIACSIGLGALFLMELAGLLNRRP
jgi:cell division protein FtsB